MLTDHDLNPSQLHFHDIRQLIFPGQYAFARPINTHQEIPAIRNINPVLLVATGLLRTKIGREGAVTV